MKTTIPSLTASPPLQVLRLTRPLLLATLLCSGCTVLTYTGPGGERFSRGSLGAATAIAALSVEAGTNGIRRVELQGYRNDSNQALTTVTDALIRAAAGQIGLTGAALPKD